MTSVDGVNVVTGETASPEQSGYVIDAGDSVEIAGWRRSLERTAAFYFTDLGDSYAARTGRPANVGVIGVAVFRENAPPAIVEQPLRDKIAAHEAQRRERGDRTCRGSAAGVARRSVAADAAPRAGRARPQTLASKLGTGFGRDETSHAQRVAIRAGNARRRRKRSSIQYDRRENLIAMGVLPSPRYAQRTPDPFPGMRFVPAPRWFSACRPARATRIAAPHARCGDAAGARILRAAMAAHARQDD